MKPLLKWAGGKRSLIPKICTIFPFDFRKNRYHEPFFGGGAIFFHLEPTSGTIGDINPRLINFYRIVRDEPKKLIEAALNYRYDEEEFYLLRERFNTKKLGNVEEAAILLYLNKTAYNGLYRVNSRGEFNVPFGRYREPNIVPVKNILNASRVLSQVEIHIEDFSYVLDSADEGDFCYLDPPYHPTSTTANFTEYYNGGFPLNEQKRLKELCVELDQRGVNLVISNSDTEPIRTLYGRENRFQMFTVSNRRLISSKISSRRTERDLLITNMRTRKPV